VREHKYRAWDEEKKGMFPVFSIEFNKDIFGKPWYLITELDTTNANTVFNRKLKREGTSYTLLEYIGIWAKNGEICEGDIVKSDSGEIFEIGFGCGYASSDDPHCAGRMVGFIAIPEKAGWTSAALGNREDQTMPDDLEIIGNKFENPELLKTKYPVSDEG